MSAALLTPFVHDVELVEVTKTTDSNRLEVLIKATTDAVDRDRERFLVTAWTHPDDLAYFYTKGRVDYNHQSRLGKTESERQRAIIGEPKPGESYTEDGAFFCPAFLYPENTYVRDLVPALKANSTRFGASVGGGAFPPAEITKSRYGPGVFDRAILDHIAICPLHEARNDETMVTLLKSIAGQLGGPEAVAATMRAAAAETPPPTAVADPFLPIIKRFLLKDARFQEHVYGELCARIDPFNPRVGEAVDFLKSAGMLPDEAERAALLAVAHVAAREGEGDES